MSRCKIAVLLVLVGCGDPTATGADAGPGSGDGGGSGGDASAVVPGTRFETAASSFAIPRSGTIDGFATWYSFASTRYWSTVDLDGDGWLDIVQTADTAAEFRVWDAAGAPYWKVFVGDAAGWAATAVEWRVPPSGRAEGFFAIGATGSGNDWGTIDIDGDGKLDLVQTADPSTWRVWDAAGSPHWKVFRGGAGGFATTATIWPVPQMGTSNEFVSVRDQSGNARWETFDLTGDGRPDLVQFADPAVGRVWDAASAPHWKIFANTGSGFAAQPKLYSVPVSGTWSGFRTAALDSGHERFLTVDLDSDGWRDLVQTADPATGSVWDAAGAPYWKRFAGGPDGFAASATPWRVPSNGLSDGFSSATRAESLRRWTLVDLDGDGDRDLVQTGDTSHGARVWDAAGTPYWKLFANDGDRFSESVLRWNVPLSTTSEGFYDAASSLRHWRLADVDHDGRTDLVQTMNPATGSTWDATGTPYWKVFRNVP